MWIILFAILLLGILVYMNRKREGFNSGQLLNIYDILTDDKTTSEEKIKLLGDPTYVLNASDVEIQNIVKKTGLSNNEKLIKIYAFLDLLIDQRNNKPAYLINKTNINFNNFFSIIKILQSGNFDNDTEKILEIKKMGKIDDAFEAVLNSTVTDSLKIINLEDTATPTLQNLINEIIYPI